MARQAPRRFRRGWPRNRESVRAAAILLQPPSPLAPQRGFQSLALSVNQSLPPYPTNPIAIRTIP
jgi:hypothetical protein